ncbi:alpha/beta hydrolase [Paucilactobacillus suebicus]|uniref:Cell surface hydrolase, membrane-bound n=1 Tax=Paucilactobacillus suebicus DSM 5007 = KCTC 3549 TaxID=1423807 RepID=A0A0R1W0A6_9LACO|nr:alpha/beta hydrolase [Paucilactobacillus suebicus]KRM11320.1 cell surface hydrolase, membrane-bound [Paucilactobacillus suebicus DSM 5007 = KCTC 3549]
MSKKTTNFKLARYTTGALGAGLVLGSAMVYRFATGFSDKQKVNGQTKSIEQNNPVDNDWIKTLKQEDWSIKTEDGLKLSASFVQNPASTGKAVILAHGLHHSRQQVWVYARMFYKMGFSLLMPDARAHGKSEGNVIGLGWLDRSDYLQWINELIKKQGEDSKILLFGISMGATTVLAVSGEDLPKNVFGIIADSGYSNVFSEGKYRLSHKYHFPSVPFVAIASTISKFHDGYAFQEGDILKQVQRNQLPLLLIHGGRDRTVPVKNVFELYHAANQPKKLYVEPNADHIESIYVNPEKYQRVVESFLALTDRVQSTSSDK